MQESPAVAKAQTAPVKGIGGATIPATREEVQVIIARRSELLTQMRAGEARKALLLQRLRVAPPNENAGIAEQLNVANESVIKLEAELAATSWQLANTPLPLLPSEGWRLLSSQQPPAPPQYDGLSPNQIASLGMAGIVLVGFPIAVAIAIRILRRSPANKPAKREIDASQHQRRMEHAVDAMAIEVERISEGQRFLTQLFAREPRQASAVASFEAPDPQLNRAANDS